MNLLRQRRFCSAIEFHLQQLGHERGPEVFEFCQFLVLPAGPGKGQQIKSAVRATKSDLPVVGITPPKCGATVSPPSPAAAGAAKAIAKAALAARPRDFQKNTWPRRSSS